MRTLKERIEVALRQEAGVRLSAADVQALAQVMGVRFRPQSQGKRKPANKTPVYTHQRWMTKSDLITVCSIERRSFDMPWSSDDFRNVLSERRCIGTVAELDDYIYGFCVYMLEPDHLRIVNLAVDPRFRGRTVGRQLVNKLRTKLHPDRRCRILVDVRESNCDAQLFFSTEGFRCIRVIDNHYCNGESAFVMEMPAAGVPYRKFMRDDLEQSNGL